MRKLLAALFLVVTVSVMQWPPPWVDAQQNQSPPALQGNVSLTSTSGALIYPLSGQSTCTLSVGGTWTGTITVTASAANLASPSPVPTSAALKDELSGGSSIAANGVYSYHTYGATVINLSAVSTGTALVQYQCSQASSATSSVPVTIASLPPVVVVAPTDAAGRLSVDLNTTPLPAPTATIGVTIQNIPTVIPSCPAVSYPCGFPTPIPTGTPYPAPAGTVFVANTPGVTIQNTPAVNQGTSPWVVSTPSAGPLPTASAGAAAPANAIQTNAYVNCILAAGAAPSVTVGNAIAQQCDAAGRLIVNPQPQATIQVNTPAPLPTMATNLYPGVVRVGPSTAPAAVNSAYSAVVDSSGNSSTKICAGTTTNCVAPTASPNAASVMALLPSAPCANNAGTINCAAVNSSQQMSVVLPTTGAAAQCTFLGGTIQKSVIAVSASATTTTVVAISGSTVVYVCGWSIYIQAGTTPAFQLESSTVGSCASGNVNITGVYGGIAGSIGELFNSPGVNGPFYTSPAGGTICIVTTGTTPTVNGTLWYVQQ